MDLRVMQTITTLAALMLQARQCSAGSSAHGDTGGANGTSALSSAAEDADLLELQPASQGLSPAAVRQGKTKPLEHPLSLI